MKMFFTVLFLVVVSEAIVVSVKANGGWTNLPYCEGRTRLTCQVNIDEKINANECYIDISRSNCTSLNLYTSSAFYSSVWTIHESVNRNQEKHIKVLANSLSGLENRYFFAFFTTEGNRSYTKIRYNLD